MTREEVIKSLETAVKNFERYSGDEYGREYDYARIGVDVLEDALALLKALDVTPEELERLKLCRHECKVDCLLEAFNKVVEERDALLKAQEPVAPELQSGGNYVCGACGVYTVGFMHPLTGESVQTWQFCGSCGKKVRWDG